MVNIVTKDLSRADNKMTYEYGRRKGTVGLFFIREFDEDVEVMKFAGQDGDPFKKLRAEASHLLATNA